MRHFPYLTGSLFLLFFNGFSGGMLWAAARAAGKVSSHRILNTADVDLTMQWDGQEGMQPLSAKGYDSIEDRGGEAVRTLLVYRNQMGGHATLAFRDGDTKRRIVAYDPLLDRPYERTEDTKAFLFINRTAHPIVCSWHARFQHTVEPHQEVRLCLPAQDPNYAQLMVKKAGTEVVRNLARSDIESHIDNHGWAVTIYEKLFENDAHEAPFSCTFDHQDRNESIFVTNTTDKKLFCTLALEDDSTDVYNNIGILPAVPLERQGSCLIHAKEQLHTEDRQVWLFITDRQEIIAKDTIPISDINVSVRPVCYTCAVPVSGQDDNTLNIEWSGEHNRFSLEVQRSTKFPGFTRLQRIAFALIRARQDYHLSRMLQGEVWDDPKPPTHTEMAVVYDLLRPLRSSLYASAEGELSAVGTAGAEAGKEATYINAKKEAAAKVLQSLFTEEELSRYGLVKKDFETYPITILHFFSGGGVRAMLSSTGARWATEELGFRKGVAAELGLSGGSWGTLAAAYAQGANPETFNMGDFAGQLANDIGHATLAELMRTICREGIEQLQVEMLHNMPMSIIELYGHALVAKYMGSQALHQKLSAMPLDAEKMPLPIVVAVQTVSKEQDPDAIGFGEQHRWVHFTPFSVSTEKGQAIDTEAFGSCFLDGRQSARGTPLSVPSIVGTGGAAMVLTAKSIGRGVTCYSSMLARCAEVAADIVISKPWRRRNNRVNNSSQNLCRVDETKYRNPLFGTINGVRDTSPTMPLKDGGHHYPEDGLCHNFPPIPEALFKHARPDVCIFSNACQDVDLTFSEYRASVSRADQRSKQENLANQYVCTLPKVGNRRLKQDTYNQAACQVFPEDLKEVTGNAHHLSEPISVYIMSHGYGGFPEFDLMRDMQSRREAKNFAWSKDEAMKFMRLVKKRTIDSWPSIKNAILRAVVVKKAAAQRLPQPPQEPS